MFLIKKYFLILSLIFFCIFYYTNFIFSADLEVNYPVIGGVAISYNTPLPVFLKYVFDFGMFLGFASAVYSLAYAGFLYLISGAKPEYLSMAKDRVWSSVYGILILVLLYLIITTLNPHLKFFKANPLEKIPEIAEQKAPGIYFYKSNDCSGDPKITTSNITDFGTDFNNQINSVLIVKEPNSSFVSTVYSSPKLFEKCKYINPNSNSCQQLENFATSASVYNFDFNPNNNGKVTFFRKPFFNPEGGWLEINNNQIKSGTNGGLFRLKLSDTTFKGNSNCSVPEDEKICEKWDNQGSCTQKKCPTLAGKEISSIKIEGNYIVLFVYKDPKDPVNGPWTYCQEFPTTDDINKEGPKQLKWEKILNQNQENLPNYLFIYPIK